MTAESIAKALGGRRVGAGWMARCPAHDDRKPSLSIRDIDGKVLVHCHAGCDHRDVIAALKECGLWDGRGRPRLRRTLHRKTPASEANAQQAKRTAIALSIWQSTDPAEGTQVDIYLARRGIYLPLPSSLRSHRGRSPRSPTGSTIASSNPQVAPGLNPMAQEMRSRQRPGALGRRAGRRLHGCGRLPRLPAGGFRASRRHADEVEDAAFERLGQRRQVEDPRFFPVVQPIQEAPAALMSA